MLPAKSVKDRLAALAVGLAADCDDSEEVVAALMTANLPGAGTLPFAAFVTPELKWIGGFSGYKEESEFLALVQSVEKSPLLNASEEGRKKLTGLVDRATKAVEKGDWKSVLAAHREGADVTGRCPERQQIDVLGGKARAWAAGRFAAAIRTAQEGGDLAEARKALNEVKKQFAGEPEAAEVEPGLKALQRLSSILTVESGTTSVSPKGLREKAAGDYRGSRWAAVFEKKAAESAAPPPEAPAK